MREKKCIKCGLLKAIDAYYVHPAMGDGRLRKCKECCKEAAREHYRENIERYKKYERTRANLPHRVSARKNYAKTETGKAAIKRAKISYISRNPKKRKAVNLVNSAVRGGRLVKAPCMICGSAHRVHGHHDNYDRPLDVVWLCPLHHVERHKTF